MSVSDPDTCDEPAIFACAHCGVPVLTWWAPNGGGLWRGEYVLVGDVIMHTRCWRELVEDDDGVRLGE